MRVEEEALKLPVKHVSSEQMLGPTFGEKSRFQCAGLNRYEAGVEETLRERTSDSLGPEFCVGYREVHSEA